MTATIQLPATVRIWAWCLLMWLTCGIAAQAQHRHINAGAKATTAGAPLFFANGSLFDAASGSFFQLNPTNHPVYGPIYFGGSEVTFTSLAATLNNGGPDPSAALPGTRIEMIFESVQGPAGGSFSFWDSFDGFFDATEITFSVPVGTTNGTQLTFLSENDGSPGVDPYGHIHGRKFSADRPGLYTVGVRLVDEGGNGPGGGPIHTPSALTYFNFQAGLTIADIAITADKTTLRFATTSGVDYFVDSANSLDSQSTWSPIAGPIAGTGKLVSLDVPAPSKAQTFFRLRTQ
jgi:hypothetical protein